MDLRNLCSKLDMDAIRARIPPLPQIKLPKSLSKLKSRKIFRSSRENINTSSRSASAKRKTSNCENLSIPLGDPYATRPPSEFVNHSPNRISTISSLMNKNAHSSGVSKKWKSNYIDDETFYRNAGGIDDYYPSPLNQHFKQQMSRPISPVRAPAPITQELRVQSEQNIKMSLGDRLQKGYKDVTEFKLKRLFAKRTIVRSDKIEINEYIHRFDEDRLREEAVQRNLDRDIADNYRFEFKDSQNESEESCIDSPVRTTRNNAIRKHHKTVSELSGDESGMESSPPPRKPGIASSRFSRVRHTPLNMSLEEDNDEDDVIYNAEEETSSLSGQNPQKFKRIDNSPQLSSAVRHNSLNSSMEDGQDEEDNHGINEEIELNVVDEDSPRIKPNASSLYGTKKYPTPERPSDLPKSHRKTKSIRERMSRLSKQKSEDDEKKRRAPLSPQESQEKQENPTTAPTKSEKSIETIKQNFKRFQKSIKLPQHVPPQSGAESENETNPENKTILTKTREFSERIRRFRSTDQINENPEDEERESPIHKIAHKLQEWRKSIKKKVDLHNADNEDDYATRSPQKPVGTLINKLKQMRSRKQDSTDDPDDDEEYGDTYKESLASRAKLQLEKGVAAASQMPQRTMKKISDTKKYFKKRQENDDKNKAEKTTYDEKDEKDSQVEMSTKPVEKIILRPPPPIPRPYSRNRSEEEDIEDKQTFIAKSIAESQLISVSAARAAWTTKPILSEDTTDYEDDLPKVLLHQDNSDVFESTLIIAVTRPLSRTKTPIITELPPDSTQESTPDTKPDSWVPNQTTIATTSYMKKRSQRTLSKDSNGTSNSDRESRNQSIESSSEDSWIKDIPRGPSVAVLTSAHATENEEPWKIQKVKPEENLYKTKSIDLFEMQKKYGSVLTAFEDFDDELKNTPVVKIENEERKYAEIRRSADHYERESSEDLEYPDDDNSSRITKISLHPREDKHNDDTKIANKLKSQSYANSRESLTGNLDDKDICDSGKEIDNDESDECKNGYEMKMANDQPPSKTPSPPPSTSSTPPPLPQRQPSIRLLQQSESSLELACPSEPPPPLPLTKPPISSNRPAPAPPKIPERNPTIRTSKPLVKTASLRLAYSEQVNPEDVGKVNKLISRFEPAGPKQKPRIIPRRSWATNESEDYSDDEDSFEILPTQQKDKMRDATPTNHPRIQKSFSIDAVDLPNNNEDLTTSNREMQTSLSRKATSQVILDNSESVTPIPSISISSSCLDINSNFSQPSSIYGSPLPYPSSEVGSTEVTPLTNRKESEYLLGRRNRRSMARDDEHFYSFDSDEENSYYSISSTTSSHRYVVEL